MVPLLSFVGFEGWPVHAKKPDGFYRPKYAKALGIMVVKYKIYMMSCRVYIINRRNSLIVISGGVH